MPPQVPQWLRPPLILHCLKEQKVAYLSDELSIQDKDDVARRVHRLDGFLLPRLHEHTNLSSQTDGLPLLHDHFWYCEINVRKVYVVVRLLKAWCQFSSDHPHRHYLHVSRIPQSFHRKLRCRENQTFHQVARLKQGKTHQT